MMKMLITMFRATVVPERASVRIASHTKFVPPEKKRLVVCKSGGGPALERSNLEWEFQTSSTWQSMYSIGCDEHLPEECPSTAEAVCHFLPMKSVSLSNLKVNAMAKPTSWYPIVKSRVMAK